LRKSPRKRNQKKLNYYLGGYHAVAIFSRSKVQKKTGDGGAKTGKKQTYYLGLNTGKKLHDKEADNPGKGPEDWDKLALMGNAKSTPTQRWFVFCGWGIGKELPKSNSEIKRFSRRSSKIFKKKGKGGAARKTHQENPGLQGVKRGKKKRRGDSSMTDTLLPVTPARGLKKETSQLQQCPTLKKCLKRGLPKQNTECVKTTLLSDRARKLPLRNT